MMGIIVTTWNGLEVTKTCIESIRTKEPHTIIISDNASTDGTQKWVHREGYAIVESKKNLGCGYARNKGAEYALAYGCDPIVWIQNDVILHKKCLDNLATVYRANNYAMLCSCGVVHMEGQESKWFNDQRVKQYNGLLNKENKETPINADTLIENLDMVKPRDVLGPASGLVVAMVSKKTIREVGLFDEGFTIADWETRDYIHRIEQRYGTCHYKEKKDWPLATTQLALHHHIGINSWLQNKVDREKTRAIEWQRCEDRYIAKWGGNFLTETHRPIEQPSLWPDMTMVRWGQ